YTYAEYLAYERDSGLKHEYDSGEILAVAGDSRRHNALASRISAALELGRRPAERRADRPGEALRQPAGLTDPVASASCSCYSAQPGLRRRLPVRRGCRQDRRSP